MARRAQADKEPLRQSIVANPYLRNLYAKAVDIADIRYDKTVPKSKRQLLVKEKEDELERLLLRYSDPQNIHSNNKKVLKFREEHGDPPVLTSEIIDFIIDATVEKRATDKTKKSLKVIGQFALGGVKTTDENATKHAEKSERQVPKKPAKPANIPETTPPTLDTPASDAEQPTTQTEPKTSRGVDDYADYAFGEILGNSYKSAPDTTDPIVETSEPGLIASPDITPDPLVGTSEPAPIAASVRTPSPDLGTDAQTDHGRASGKLQRASLDGAGADDGPDWLAAYLDLWPQ